MELGLIRNKTPAVWLEGETERDGGFFLRPDRQDRLLPPLGRSTFQVLVLVPKNQMDERSTPFQRTERAALTHRYTASSGKRNRHPQADGPVVKRHRGSDADVDLFGSKYARLLPREDGAQTTLSPFSKKVSSGGTKPLVYLGFSPVACHNRHHESIFRVNAVLYYFIFYPWEFLTGQNQSSL